MSLGSNSLATQLAHPDMPAALTAVGATLWAKGPFSESVVIHRGATELPAQTVRMGLAERVAGQTVNGVELTINDALIVGAPTLDIRKDDRFTVDGFFFDVVGVSPNREVQTVAYARVQQ